MICFLEIGLNELSLGQKCQKRMKQKLLRGFISRWTRLQGGYGGAGDQGRRLVVVQEEIPESER